MLQKLGNITFNNAKTPHLTGGAVVFAYNLGGDVKNLRLSRQAYCGIVQGNIKTWNNPLIAKQNPNVNLPNTSIRFVHR
ncbi:MAG: substrate-binding domain-containing protein [Microcystaceae cyanobacterium]